MMTRVGYWLAVAFTAVALQGWVGLPTAAASPGFSIAAISIAAAILWGCARVRGSGWRGAVMEALAQLVFAAAAAALGHVLVTAMASRQIDIPVLGRLSASVASLFGDVGATASGSPVIQGRSGALVFAPTAIKSGPILVSMGMAAVCIAAFASKQRVRSVLIAIVLSTLVVVTRLAMEMLTFADVPNVLGAPAGWLLLFTLPERQFGWCLALAVLLGLGGAPMLTRRPESGPSRWWLLSVPCLAALVAVGVSVRVPSQPFGGRVVIDDLHSDYWAMAGRRMSKGWYGDFSTYNLAAATENLGYFCDVSVNRSEPYSDETLRGVDTLVLKTPTEDFAPAEEKAILEFVARGGGLVLIGDHTNLLGMSSRLNRFATVAGIGFVFDGVGDDLRRRFSRSNDAGWTDHPVAGDLGSIEYLTGCSLKLHPRAEPLCVSWGQTRKLGDYSTSSYFGTLANDPRTDVGPVPHAAAARYGKGTVVAFSDSTCMSSFALFLFERDALFRNLVTYAGSSPLAWRDRWGWWLAAMGALGCIWILFRFRGATIELGLTGTGALCGAFAGLALVGVLHRHYWPDLEPARAVPTVEYLIGNSEGIVPPVLGSSNPEWVPHSYDTFFAAISRIGRMPEPVMSPLDGSVDDSLIAINPARPFTAVEQEAVRRRLDAGQSLIVGTRSERVRIEVLQAFLAASEMRLRETETGVVVDGATEQAALASGRVRIFVGEVGAGRVVLVVGTEHWSREELGHAFAVPGRERRELYGSIYTVLERLGRLGVSDRGVYRIDG